MSKLHRHMYECLASHTEHHDAAGAEAIAYAMAHGIRKAKHAFPDQRAVIDNAVAYAKQEMGVGFSS